jgi:hypothetical protein
MIDRIDLTEAQRKSRRNRNIAIGVALAALAILFYAVTIIKMAPGAMQ